MRTTVSPCPQPRPRCSHSCRETWIPAEAMPRGPFSSAGGVGAEERSRDRREDFAAKQSPLMLPLSESGAQGGSPLVEEQIRRVGCAADLRVTRPEQPEVEGHGVVRCSRPGALALWKVGHLCDDLSRSQSRELCSPCRGVPCDHVSGLVEVSTGVLAPNMLMPGGSAPASPATLWKGAGLSRP